MKQKKMTSLVFVILLFQSWTIGRSDKYHGTSTRFQRKTRGETFRGLQGYEYPKAVSKGMKSMRKRMKRSKAKFVPVTSSPTATQSPLPSTAIPSPSPTASIVPGFSTATPTSYTQSPVAFDQTFNPTISSSAPTYIVSNMPSGSPSANSIRPSSPVKAPTSRPSQNPTTRQPQVRPTNSPIAQTINPTKGASTPAPVLPTPAPPTPTQSPPTQRPQSLPPTTAPTQVNGPKVVNLSPFTLNYTFTRPRLPFRTEFIELASVTGMYLENSFRASFRNSTGIDLGAVVAIYNTASISSFGSPVQVQFDAVASFNPNSTTIPSVNQLDNLLVTSLSGNGVSAYVTFIQSQITATNTFATTQNVTLVANPSSTNTNPAITREGSGNSGDSVRGHALSIVAVSVGALAAIALVAAIAVAYRRHAKFDPTRNINKTPPSYTTVAGGTCDSSTIQDSSSVEGRLRFQGANEINDECDRSIGSSKWDEFVNETDKICTRRTPKQMMTEMELATASLIEK